MTAKSSNMHILLVDDDAHIRRICRKILEREGFLVVEADSPAVALQIWNLNQSEINLLVTDHDMPGMTGLQLLESLRETVPSLKALLISGNVIDTQRFAIPFLQKPFSAEQLSHAVRAQLTTHHPTSQLY